ncbi:MAG: TA system VapC family ribonuclease toxin [Vicinamibacterales bacterium]
MALSHAAHVHHEIAHDWFTSLDGGAHLAFCRITQLGFLRLLTAEAVMGDDAVSQATAWQVYDAWRRDDRVSFLEEPPGLDAAFRRRTQRRQAATKQWADAYLSAFAEASGATLVTFDRALRTGGGSVAVLGP